MNSTEPTSRHEQKAQNDAKRKAKKTFISYRRRDSAGWVGHLVDDLSRLFGVENVFYDVHSVEPGRNWLEAIERTIASSDVVLVVIGPGWLHAARDDGTRRLDGPEDLVRLEVEQALRLRARVVPTLVGEAKMPSAELLPKEIKGLSHQQAIELRDGRWDDDVAALLRTIGHKPQAPKSPFVALAAVSTAAFLSYWFWDSMFSPIFETKDNGELTIASGETRNFLVDLKRRGPVELVLGSISAERGGTPELYHRICSSKSNACASEGQISNNSARSAVLPSGRATVQIFNFNDNPQVKFHSKISYPGR